jgi:hypothetical protein
MTATAERDCLLAELGVVRGFLRAGRRRGEPDAETRHAAARALLEGPTRLDVLAEGFDLTAFERAVLLLAAGPELVAATANEIAAAGGDPRPTFGLALSVLPEPDWSAVTPQAPLRRWQLVRLLDPSSPTRSPLVVDERVLHHLMGAGYPDPDVTALTRPAPAAQPLPPTLAEAAEAVAAGWAEGRLVSLSGPQHDNLALVAATAARETGRALHLVAAADVPAAPHDRDRLFRLLERESVLDGCAWAVDVDGAECASLLRALPSLDAPAVVLGPGQHAEPAASTVHVAVDRLPMPERRAVLAGALRRAVHRGGPPPDEVASTAAVFDLTVPDVELAAAEVARGRELWDACRDRARSRFGGTARVLQARADWNDLVLPPVQLEQLHALVAAVRHRATVLDGWGFAGRSARGLGSTALFTGPSGTGKTLAAEVVATALELDLVVVDLSQVVSKYIGETEKNLGRVFDAAEDGAGVLLFDEADTLFGKRTEVRDSHDRYSNLEVGYLLQRMESFRGLAILTTNAKSVLDQAFLRRLRVVVSFPYPDTAAREAMWRRAFPAGTPTSGLDPARLAAIDLPGGGIASAALAAAYLGAERGQVAADDVAAAARWELAKHGRTFTG